MIQCQTHCLLKKYNALKHGSSNVHNYILDQMENYFGGFRSYVPYTGNFASIRNSLNKEPFSPDDPNCRCLTFYNGILVDEGALVCDGTMIG